MFLYCKILVNKTFIIFLVIQKRLRGEDKVKTHPSRVRLKTCLIEFLLSTLFGAERTINTIESEQSDFGVKRNLTSVLSMIFRVSLGPTTFDSFWVTLKNLILLFYA